MIILIKKNINVNSINISAHMQTSVCVVPIVKLKLVNHRKLFVKFCACHTVYFFVVVVCDCVRVHVTVHIILTTFRFA